MDAGKLEKLREMAEAVATEQGLLLFDLETKFSGKEWSVIVTLDRMDGNVGLSDCEQVSRKLSTLLDVEDIIQHHYRLEVSSPGIERPLRRPEDYERFKGRKAKLVLVSDEKNPGGVLEGTLTGLKNGEITLDIKGEESRVAPDRIKRANLIFDFDR